MGVELRKEVRWGVGLRGAVREEDESSEVGGAGVDLGSIINVVVCIK